MTDPNRGAYTPQSDAPLSFDARRAGGARGPMPITLIFSALILLVLVIGGGIAILYHNGARKAGQPPQPVGETVGAVRAPSETQNAPLTTAPTVTSGAAPTFTAPPEQPAARPAAVTPPPPPPPAPKAAPVAAAPAPAPVTIAPPAAKAEPVKTPAPVVKPAPPVAKLAEAAPKAAAGGAMVQIGAYSTTGMADSGWNEVAKLMPGQMAGKTKVVEKLDRDGKTLYRTLIGGFSTHADAERLCLALLSKGRDCSVK